MKKIIIILFLFFITPIFSSSVEGYYEDLVKKFTVRKDGIVKINLNYWLCNGGTTTGATFDIGWPGGNAMLSVLITAKTFNSNLIVNYTCTSGKATIDSIQMVED